MSERQGGDQGGRQGGREFSLPPSLPQLPGLNCDDARQGGNHGGRQGPPNPASARVRRGARRRPSLSGPVERDGDTRRHLVSLGAAAAYVDVSVRTLRRYISQGRLTGYRVGPRLIKVDLHEVAALTRPIPAPEGDRRAT